MIPIKLEKLSSKALELFADAKKAFAGASSLHNRGRAMAVPTSFVDEDKNLSIVFVGQYSAGKSSILSILTGQKLEVGQGVTTERCNYLDWNGIEVVDTPGIHTAKRPDHDATTYQAIAEADLIIFVCTAEGFSQNLGEHFRKLLVEKGKGNEMMLVFNKMEDSLYGNTVEGQQEFFERDVKPVISPEYTAEDLYITYIDTRCYQDAQETKEEDKRKLLEMSGYPQLFENINKFVSDKKLLGKCTTSLSRLEQLLFDALSETNTNDICVDGSLKLLNEQRKALVNAKEHIQTAAHDIIRRNTQEVRNWGFDIANKLAARESLEAVNKEFEEKYEQTNAVYSQALKELEGVISSEFETLKKVSVELEGSDFAETLKSTIELKIEELKQSGDTASALHFTAAGGKLAAQWLTAFATGPKAAGGWSAIFKLSSYSGSYAHQAVLGVGHSFGVKFVPWSAVKIAAGIGKFAKVLGVAGAFLAVGLQIWDTVKGSEREKELQSYRNGIRNSFNEAANVINMKFDEETQTWVKENILSEIEAIDAQMFEIEGEITRTHEIDTYGSLLTRTQTLIKEVRQAI